MFFKKGGEFSFMYDSPDFVKVEMNVEDTFLSYSDGCYYGSDKHFIRAGDHCEDELSWEQSYVDIWPTNCTFSNVKVI